MTGSILGIDESSQTLLIKGEDGNRYSVSLNEWRGGKHPNAGINVDFDLVEGIASAVFPLQNQSGDIRSAGMGIVALILTFFLGFIGTAITRFAIARQDNGEAVKATLIHLALDLLFIIPILGWAIALVANIYFMIANYKLCANSNA